MFTAVPPLMAPQTTGHPAGLPQDVARQNPETRITAPKAGAGTDSARGDAQQGQSGLWIKTASGEKAAAPPTILQIQINTMLKEQQEERAQEANRDAEAAAPRAEAKATPAPTATEAAARPEPVSETPEAEVADPVSASAKPAANAGTSPPWQGGVYGAPSQSGAAGGHEVSLIA